MPLSVASVLSADIRCVSLSPVQDSCREADFGTKPRPVAYCRSAVNPAFRWVMPVTEDSQPMVSL